MQYEISRPVVLWGQTPKERGEETGVSPRTIYYRANLFDQAGMASLLSAAPPLEIPRQDKHALPPDIRQEIVDLYTQYSAFRPHELATICFVKCNRKPAPATIKLILASGPKPSTTERRYPRDVEIEDSAERRRRIIRLHADGWNAKSIASYLDVSRQTVHTTLKCWAEEQFAGLEEKSHARTGRSQKSGPQSGTRGQKACSKSADLCLRRERRPGTDGDYMKPGYVWPSSCSQSRSLSPPGAAQAASKGRDAISSRA